MVPATRLMPAVLGLVVPLLLFGVMPALAHGHHGPARIQFQGTVIGVNNGSLEVQTSVGSVSCLLTPTSHVFRRVSGSTADLHANQHVDIHLIHGSTTVDWIQINAAMPKRTPHPPSQGKHADDGPPSFSEWVIPPHHPLHGPPDYLSGQIIAIDPHSITIRPDHLKVVKFNLGGSVTITKILSGSVRDLAMGEIVRVLVGRAGNVISVTILNS